MGRNLGFTKSVTKITHFLISTHFLCHTKKSVLLNPLRLADNVDVVMTRRCLAVLQIEHLHSDNVNEKLPSPTIKILDGR